MPSSVRGAGGLVIAALLVGLFARLAFGLGYWRDKALTHDEREYLAFALNLSAGRGFVRELPGKERAPTEETFSRAPLYPALLAVVFRATGQPTDRLPASVPRSVQVVQSVVGAVAIWLIAVLAGRAAGSRAAAIAAWVAALHPALAWSCAYALSEIVYSVLVLGSVCVLGPVLDPRRSVWHVAYERDEAPGGRLPDVHHHELRAVARSGALAGVAALARSAALVFVALTAVWLLWRRRPVLAAALAVAATLVIAPWTLRNVIVHGRPIVVAADGGITFWTGNHPLAIGEGDMAANPSIKAAHVAFRAPLQHLTPEQREPYYYRAAWRFIAEQPRRWLLLLSKKFFYTWVPVGPSYTLHSALYYWATVLSYVPLLLLSLAAIPVLARSPTPPIALGLLVASSVVVCLVFFPQERFRIPVVDPALCVAAAACIDRFGRDAT